MVRLKFTRGLYFVAAPLLVAVVVVASKSAVGADSPTPVQQVEALLGIADETDTANSPIDYGSGPGVKPAAQAAVKVTATTKLAVKATVPVGGSTANVTGAFGAPVTWPVIAIHAALLPDGRVMSYGTNSLGQQGAELVYDLWNPTLGTGTAAHMTLPNTTQTDLFCGAQSVMLSGDVLTSGGDLTVNGKRNSANNDTTIFSPSANTLTKNTPMSYARWYGSLVALPNGQLAIFGGRQNVSALAPVKPATTPEIYDPALGSWTSLTGATSSPVFGTNWWYPRAYVAPGGGGSVFVLSDNGYTYYVSTTGVGSITPHPKVKAPAAGVSLPTINYAPGLALSLRQDQEVVVVDFRTSTPVVTPTASMDQVRYWASGTILADGRVLINGGSEVANKLTGVAYQTQIWNPATGLWTAGASATKPRLYHSTALLLPDATVLTAGGGAPGPMKNLNAEIYYPPYLYTAGGTPAVRPTIVATAAQSLDPGDTIDATVGPTDVISRLTFVRMGSSTHSSNSDQRFINLTFAQEGQNITAVLPTDTTVLVPGFYMLFAFNSAGVPSVASVIKVM